MWSAGSEIVHVFLGRNRIGWATKAEGVVWDTTPTDVAEGAHRLFERVTQTHPGKRCALQVWLSGALARPFLVGPVAGLTSWGEVKRLARSLAQGQAGHSSPCEVWLSGDPTQETVLGVAVEGSLLALLNTLAQEHRTRLASIQPWWAQAAGGVESAGGHRLLVVDDGEALTVLHREAHGFGEPATHWPSPDRDQALNLLMRKAAANNLMNDACALVGMRQGPKPQDQQAGDTQAFAWALTSLEEELREHTPS